MTPLPETPQVLVLIGAAGVVTKIASNISPNIELLCFRDPEAFQHHASGLIPNQDNPVEVVHITPPLAPAVIHIDFNVLNTLKPV
jgi:hypothetical protein